MATEKVHKLELTDNEVNVVLLGLQMYVASKKRAQSGAAVSDEMKALMAREQSFATVLYAKIDAV